MAEGRSQLPDVIRIAADGRVTEVEVRDSGVQEPWSWGTLLGRIAVGIATELERTGEAKASHVLRRIRAGFLAELAPGVSQEAAEQVH